MRPGRIGPGSGWRGCAGIQGRGGTASTCRSHRWRRRCGGAGWSISRSRRYSPVAGDQYPVPEASLRSVVGSPPPARSRWVSQSCGSSTILRRIAASAMVDGLVLMDVEMRDSRVPLLRGTRPAQRTDQLPGRTRRTDLSGPRLRPRRLRLRRTPGRPRPPGNRPARRAARGIRTVEVWGDDYSDGFGEGVEWSAVVGVEDSAGLEVRDGVHSRGDGAQTDVNVGSHGLRVRAASMALRPWFRVVTR